MQPIAFPVSSNRTEFIPCADLEISPAVRRCHDRLTLTVADPLHECRRLQDQSEHARLRFNWTDLELLLTYAMIAEAQRNVGNRKVAARMLAKAKKSYAALLPLFPKATGLTAELEQEFHSKFKRLRKRLDRLRRLA